MPGRLKPLQPLGRRGEQPGKLVQQVAALAWPRESQLLVLEQDGHLDDLLGLVVAYDITDQQADAAPLAIEPATIS